jgi:4'-phosphopantetheinyl transferase
VGVDVERVRDPSASIRIAERFFHELEVAALTALPPRDRGPAFFGCWTAKEALLKAAGLGIGHIEKVMVPVDPPGPETVPPPGADGEDLWLLVPLDPGEGYAGALVITGRYDGVTIRRLAVHGDPGVAT